MGGEQPDDVEARLLGTAGRISSSSGRTGESMKNASSPRRTSVHVVCQMRDVATRTSGCSPTARTPRAYAAPSSFAASRRFLTSAVGFFWPESSSSLLRLTQITGTLALMHGSTSW